MGRQRANSGNGLRQSLAGIVQDVISGQPRAFSRSGVAAPEDGRTPAEPGQMIGLSRHLAKLMESVQLPEDVTLSVDIDPVKLS